MAMTKSKKENKTDQMSPMTSVKRLLNYLRPYRWMTILVLFITIAVTFLSVLTPVYMGKIINHLQVVVVDGKSTDFSYIQKIILYLVLLYSFNTILDIVQERILVFLSQRIIYDLRVEISQKVKKIPLTYFDEHQTGDLLSRMTNDIDIIGRNIQLSVNRIFSSILLIVGTITMMLVISPVLSAVFLFTIPLNYLATRMITKRSQKYFQDKSQGLGTMVGYVEENFSGTDLVKAYGYEEQSDQEFKEINDHLFEVSYRASFMAGVLQPIMIFIGNISYILIAGIGGYLVIQSKMMIGDILAFIQYSQEIRRPIDVIADMANTLQEMLASAGRVFEFLDAPEEVENVEDEITLPIESIEFDHVSFGYDADDLIIRDLNLSINRGETIAIVGPTGAGKTTLVNLLLRFYDVTSGQIKINGIDIRTVSRDNLRSFFGMVLQETWLIQGSIYENILYGNAQATQSEVEEASKQAHAHHFIEALPDGYQTILKEEATNISQGQQQLLTIARAFVSNPDILILDEATSSVDTRTEQLIQQGMKNLMAGRTNFVIAHRLSTIVDADTIIVLDQGQIVEQGTHSELLRKDGMYAELYDSQFLED